jgi:hypothetical protein
MFGMDDEIDCSTVWRWTHAKGLKSFDLPPDGVEVDPGYFLKPGKINPASLEMLDAMAATAARCAPWVTMYLAPVAVGPNGDFRGIAFYSGPKIAVTIKSPSYAMSTLHHEIFHEIEHDGGEAVHVRGQARRDGRSYPAGYYDSNVERSARLYQHFAGFLDEGGPLLQRGTFTDGSPDLGNDATNIMHRIYSGRYAVDREAAIAARLAEEERAKKKAARMAAFKSLVGFKKAA